MNMSDYPDAVHHLVLLNILGLNSKASAWEIREAAKKMEDKILNLETELRETKEKLFMATMNPNETLTKARSAILRMETTESHDEHSKAVEDLKESFQALDEFLGNKGELPKDWQQ